MTDLTVEQVKEFLATEEGAKLAEEVKNPLLQKRDELLGQLSSVKEELNGLKTTEQTRQDELATATRTAEEQRIKDTNDFEAYKSFHEEEVGKYKEQIGTFKNKFAQKEVDRLITQTAASQSKTPAPLALLLKERVKAEVSDDTGEVSLTVLDGEGKTMYYEGQPAGLNHLVESLKSDEAYSPFFAGTGVSGSGTTKSETIPTGSISDMDSASFNLTKAMAKKA